MFYISTILEYTSFHFWIYIQSVLDLLTHKKTKELSHDDKQAIVKLQEDSSALLCESSLMHAATLRQCSTSHAYGSTAIMLANFSLRGHA